MNKSILISAGEASGDLHGANMLKALLKIEPELKAHAMGSTRLRDSGAKIIVDCADIAVVGLWEVVLNYKKIKAALDTMQNAIKRIKPDLLILVDYQEFNLKLAKTAKQHGVKVLFYISPQVWAWRPHRVHNIGKFIDMIAVLFPFEEKFYKDAGVPVTFVGHPLVDEVKPGISKTDAYANFQLKPENKIIGLFPGSRGGEVKRILPLMLAAAQKLKQKIPDIEFILPVANTMIKFGFNDYLAKYPSLSVKLVADENIYDVMQVCDVIATASGTASLEIALMGIPNVIVYKISSLSYLMAKRMVHIDHIGLANIVAGKDIITELLQDKARPDNIAKEIQQILEDADYRDNMLDNLAEIRNKLGKTGGVQNIAELAHSMLG